jgi:hypothetical protein
MHHARKLAPSLLEIHPARIPRSQALDSGLNPRAHLNVSAGVEPLNENVRFPNFDHSANVAVRLHFVNRGHGAARDQSSKSRALHDEAA